MNLRFQARKKLAILGMASMSILTACCKPIDGDNAQPNDSSTAQTTVTTANVPNSEIPLGAQALINAYPNQIKGFDGKNIIFADSSTMLYDDGKKKDFAMRLNDCDIEDMFTDTYAIPDDQPAYQADAGRYRNETLFKKMYGNSATQVEKNLVTVPWFGQKLKFSNINGAADQLKKVAEELATHPDLKKYMKSAGTFYWRKVRGAQRMSAHSYGIAIDIGGNWSDFWQWRNPRANENSKIKYTNRIPLKIAEIFQKHGFIWGGAWYHFDTMHFEYRPEIIEYSRLQGNK